MMRLIRGLTAAALIGGAALSPAAAQILDGTQAGRTAPPCVLDKCLDQAGSAPTRPSPAPVPVVGPSSVAPGAFDFYVLSLSWSPGFCDTGGAEKGGDQCAPGAGLGFVVHGLWPQNTRGYPSGCDSTARNPTRAALQATRGLYPSIGLAVHEWREHGTCTGLGPVDYFAAVRRAFAVVTIPPALAAPHEPQTLGPTEITRAFTASNPGLRADTMAVTCRQGELQEVRLCFTKDLRGFTPCPEVARAACRSRSLSVLPVQ